MVLVFEKGAPVYSGAFYFSRVIFLNSTAITGENFNS